jgi:1-acyl-sn-glycerol-3-phosphate acyltransferase
MKLYSHAYHYLLRAAVPVLTRIEVQGLEHIPRTGPAILVSNHISMIDPTILIGYVKRQIHFIIKAELLDQLVFRILLPPNDPISIRRGKVDRVALRKAEAVLKAGELIGIFPEGTRSHSGGTQEAHAGVIFLAHRTGAPIVPVAISGTEDVFQSHFPWYHRARIRLTIGQPFTLADLGDVRSGDREALAHAVMARVAALLPARYRGIYAA